MELIWQQGKKSDGKYLPNPLFKQNYFWRTYDQQELDWLETEAEDIAGYEFKWNENKKSKIPTAFAKAYPEAAFEVITKKNYLDFIM